MNEVGRSKAHAWLVNGALAAIALLSLAPLAWMASTSFSQVMISGRTSLGSAPSGALAGRAVAATVATSGGLLTA